MLVSKPFPRIVSHSAALDNILLDQPGNHQVNDTNVELHPGKKQRTEKSSSFKTEDQLIVCAYQLALNEISAMENKDIQHFYINVKRNTQITWVEWFDRDQMTRMLLDQQQGLDIEDVDFMKALLFRHGPSRRLRKSDSVMMEMENMFVSLCNQTSREIVKKSCVFLSQIFSRNFLPTDQCHGNQAVDFFEKYVKKKTDCKELRINNAAMLLQAFEDMRQCNTVSDDLYGGMTQEIKAKAHASLRF